MQEDPKSGLILKIFKVHTCYQIWNVWNNDPKNQLPYEILYFNTLQQIWLLVEINLFMMTK